MILNATAWRPSTPPSSWSGRSLWILPLLLVALALTSCAHGTRPTAAIPAELLALVNPIDPVGEDLTAPCPQELPPAVDGSLGGLSRNHQAAARIYHDCKDSKARLAAAARDREREERVRIERARRALERKGDR